MNKTETKETGDLGERIAVRYLRRHFYRIRARNFRAGHREIDVIAETLRDLVFVEVKTRTYEQADLATAPPPQVAVNAEKQRLTRAAALDYLAKHPTRKQPRMDVIEVCLVRDERTSRLSVQRINHIKAAY